MTQGRYEDGTPVGNFENKYESKNPIARALVKGFLDNVRLLAKRRANEIDSIAEFGCGEGYLTRVLAQERVARDIKACDFSAQIIEVAKAQPNPEDIRFYQRSIYDILPEEDGADLVVCCEVLEHLEDPEAALIRLEKVCRKYCLLSVPREPIWRIMNMARGKYLSALGNTPGHLNHWTAHGFLGLISAHFELVEVRKPLPWTIVLAKKRN